MSKYSSKDFELEHTMQNIVVYPGTKSQEKYKAEHRNRSVFRILNCIIKIIIITALKKCLTLIGNKY